MFKRGSMAVVLFAMVLLMIAPGRVKAQSLPITVEQWTLDGPDAAIETHQGRTALCLRGSGAEHRSARFRDGVLDFLLTMGPRRGFIGVKTRAQSATRFEDLYFRTHKPGQPDAVQYVPEFDFDGPWQLYHGEGYTAAADWAPDVWTRVRIVMRGDRAALFVGDTSKPVLVVPRLVHAPVEGTVGFWSFAPGAPRHGPCTARITDVSIRPVPTSFQFPPRPAVTLAAGTITTWQLSAPFDAGDSTVRSLPPVNTQWRQVEAEDFGSVVINRHISPLPAFQRKGVWARVVILSDSARTVPFDFGYSDDASVFLNRRLLYSGQNGFRLNFPRREGLVVLESGTLYLELRAGRNELLMAISEVANGWGFTGRLLPTPGVRIERPAPTGS